MLTLSHPVHTLDNRVLLPAGAELSREALQERVLSSRPPSCETCSLLGYGSLKDDLLKFLSVPPYHAIYTDQEEIAEVLNLMDTIELPVPVLQSLEYFRQHDFHTYQHIIMVFCLSTLLAKDLLPSYEDQVRLATSGPIHDIGKICVPLRLLKKTTPLTRAERVFLEHHTAAGYVLLAYYLGDERSLPSMVARDHHERNDGSGYPRGVRIGDPMVEIIAVCDVYDALVSPRPYRAVSYENRAALEEVIGMAESNKVGWDFVKALVARNRKSKPHYGKSVISLEKRGAPPPKNVYGVFADDKE